MTAAIEKAIDRTSKHTTKPLADKKAEGFYLTGSLSLKKTDQGINAKLSMAFANWTKKSMFVMPNFEASTRVGNPAKIDNDADAVIDALVDNAQTEVVKVLEKRVK